MPEIFDHPPNERPEPLERPRIDSHVREPGRARALGWAAVLVVGVLIVLLGAFAIGASFLSGIVTMAVLGGLLIAGGVAEMLGAFRFRARGLAAPFLAGVLSVIVGALLVTRPIAGLAATGALIGSFYVASGLFRAITSLVDRHAHWGWDLFYGVVATALGAYVLATWPISALWLVGTLVGVELVLRGIAWIGAGIALRRFRDRLTPVHTPIARP